MSRADTSANGTTVFFGDNNVNPPGPELVKTSLQNALPFQLKGKRVSLKEFVLYVYDPAKSVDSGLLNSAAGSVKGGYAAAPFAGLLVGGINSMTSEKTIRVLISGAVDGAEFSTNVADHYRGLSNEEHIQATLSKALENVVIDVKRAIEMK